GKEPTRIYALVLPGCAPRLHGLVDRTVNGWYAKCGEHGRWPSAQRPSATGDAVEDWCTRGGAVPKEWVYLLRGRSRVVEEMIQGASGDAPPGRPAQELDDWSSLRFRYKRHVRTKSVHLGYRVCPRLRAEPLT